MQNLPHFFDFARERYRIFLKREASEPRPWTDDPILRQWRFCNIFREDDRTTRWFAENVRDELAEAPLVLLSTVVFRWFNRISTGRRLKPLLLACGWNRSTAQRVLSGVKPLVTGAYIIKTPNGKCKLEGICDCIDTFAKDAAAINIIEQKGCSLQLAHDVLMRYPYLGPFMAYEVVTDLRHTYLLRDAPDIHTWASPGPGCARGLGWVVRDDPTAFRYTSKKWRAACLLEMQGILDESRRGFQWPLTWPAWEMREVEHTLCEYDKWRRAMMGKTLKRRYA